MRNHSADAGRKTNVQPVPDGAGTYAGNIRNFLELVHGVCGDMVVVCGKALDRVMPPIGTNDLTKTAAYGSRAGPQNMMAGKLQAHRRG